MPDEISYEYRNGGATQRKLTWEEASELRSQYRSGLYDQNELAERYGVTQPVVSKIVRGEHYVYEPEYVIGDLRISATRPERRAVPPIPSTMSGNLPAQLPGEDINAFVARHNAPIAAHYARIDARSEALMPHWRDEYAAAVASVRAYWHALGLEGVALDADVAA